MPDPSVWQEEFPFESRIALPEGVQPLPVRRAPERSSEPPRPADFHAPSPEPHFPGIFSLASEPNGAACEVHLLQEEEFPDAEGDVPDEPPDLAESVLRPRHPSDRRLPARVMFVSKESGHHGMDALDYRTPSVPEEVSEHPPVIVLGDASQSRGHLARGVKLAPCPVIGFLPLFPGHERMVNNRLEGIVVVQISVHRYSGHVLPDMILRSREGCENEERHLVEADSFQCFDVLRDCLRRVRREPEDVAGVAGDTVLVIPRAHLGIVPDLVLALPRCIQGFLPDGFHAHEDLVAAGLGKKFGETGNFPGHKIRFDHEAELKPFHPQSHEPFEDVLPMRVSRKIVVREEEKGLFLFAARASHTVHDCFHAPVARIVPLDVNDRAEATGEGAAASGVECMHPAEEISEIMGRILGQWRRYKRRPSATVERFRFAPHDISQDLMPNPFGLAMEQNNSSFHEFGAFGGHYTGTGDIRIAVSVMKHGDGTAYVESTHHDGRALRFEFQRNLPGPWEHVGLNSHETDDNSSVGSGMFFHDLQGVHSASHGSFVKCDYPAEKPGKLRRGKSSFSQ